MIITTTSGGGGEGRVTTRAGTLVGGEIWGACDG